MPPRNMSYEKAPKGSFKKNISKLIVYCKNYWLWMAVAIIFGLAGTVIQIIGPNKIKDLANEITVGLFSGGINIENVTKIAVLLLILYVVGAILSYVQHFITSTVTQKVVKNLRKDISIKINKMPLNYFDTHLHGDVLSRVTNDVDVIGQSLNESIGTLFSSVLLFGGVLIMMFVTEWIMAFTVIGATIIGFGISMIFMSKSQKYFNQNQKNMGELNAHIEENYSGHNVVQLFNAKEKSSAEFERINKNLFKTGWKSQFVSGVMGPLMGFIGNFGYVCVCIVGALLAADRGITYFGVITAFMIYARLFSNPLSQIAQALTSLQSASAASGRVFEFLEFEEMKDESGKKPYEKEVKGDVEFRNVRFAYNADKIIIHNFSTKVKKGQKIAIVGPTGAGKTTLVNLLMRFYELKSPLLIVDNQITAFKIFENGKSLSFMIDEEGYPIVAGQKLEHILSDATQKGLKKNTLYKFDKDFNLTEDDKVLKKKLPIVVGDDLDKIENCDFGVAYFGDIFIDGVPTKSLKRDDIHKMFGMVLQDTWLFEGTIAENMRYNNDQVSREQIVEACKKVGVDHFIQTLPKGYDTVIDDAVNLSAGQKQLLTIARTMIENRPMMILDEATSSVDTRTEILLQNAMDHVMEGRTSFIIAHRLSTIKNADLILVLKDGDIIESGNHENLLAKGGFYAELYNSQFEEE